MRTGWMGAALGIAVACMPEAPPPTRPAPATEPAVRPEVTLSPEGLPTEPARAEPEPSTARSPTAVADDWVVAPPEAVVACAEKLAALGVDFQLAEMPLKQAVQGVFTCGAHDAVVYKQGPTGLRVSPPALMTCRMAMALVDLEKLIQELATRHLGSKVKRLQHAGTYNCRKMVRFDLVSEHSYGNAIDVASFVLEDGRSISVFKHFGKLDTQPPDARARFLREFGEQAFDRSLVSVSLGPYWDAAHRDHFHFDMARYRVDGSRPH